MVSLCRDNPHEPKFHDPRSVYFSTHKLDVWRHATNIQFGARRVRRLFAIECRNVDSSLSDRETANKLDFGYSMSFDGTEAPPLAKR